ncbi:DUF4345 domain-containing protein [Amycolatopsis sp. H20-H5]|uniref:DUF4345 domain-containing protein n=1 Tax=Amycolatopsis sp. H20-H5 TaxID=3046309 RepID=UPI002DB67C28|nr:DUF4345 domain-containing protein [Amycolatopsis sp. H20-H5]MEC3980578.1 DUF4345 domain-containing protein [Amycolatopsis sp. H20-H5]
MARFLKGLMLVMGIACVAIGAFHFVLGIGSVPGEGGTGATVDSRERFYGATFLGYGLLWVWAARQSPISAKVVRWLAGIFLLGAAGRVLSLIVYGQPQWFQLVLTVVELVLPPVFFWLSTADEKAAALLPGTGATPMPRPTS